MGVAERELLAIVIEETRAVADDGDVCDPPPIPIAIAIPIPNPGALVIDPGGDEEVGM